MVTYLLIFYPYSNKQEKNIISLSNIHKLIVRMKEKVSTMNLKK